MIKKKNHFLFKIFVFLVFVVNFNAFAVSIVYAQEGGMSVGGYEDPFSQTSVSGGEFGSGVAAAMSIRTNDQENIMATIWSGIKQIYESVKEFDAWVQKWHQEDWAALAFKKAVGKFLNKLAYDTATYLATGDKGQAPMFNTDGIGETIKNAGDAFAGDFLEQLGKSNRWGVKFNVCDPSFDVKLKIGAGLYESVRPREPECTFSEMKKNWAQEIKRKDFLSRFQTSFDPKQNDLGIALTLNTKLSREMSKKANEKLAEYITNKGFKAVTEKISGEIKTPPAFVENAGKHAQDESSKKPEIYTGHIVADTITTFVSTLAGRLLDKWLNEGIVNRFPDYSYKGGWGGFDKNYFSDYYASPYNRGIAGAKEQFKKIVQPNFRVRGDYDILGELSHCPDPNNADVTECVITEKFGQAVSQRMTVGDALEDGYINKDGIFGFNADGLEPSYLEGYPYRTLIILRKYRIIPVLWELTAQKIKERYSDSNTTKTIGELIACFDPNDKYEGYFETWCEGLIDPSWVLKAPLNYCKKEGPGPKILSKRVTGKGANSRLSIARKDTYCADEQTCIREKKDGSCEVYGYCTKERRKWDFDSDSCNPLYNTCQSYRARDGSTIGFLKNTLLYNECSADNAGCAHYILPNSNYDVNQGKVNWRALADLDPTTVTNQYDDYYFNKNIEKCSDKENGCHQFIRLKNGLGANLLINSGFERLDNQSALSYIDYSVGDIPQIGTSSSLGAVTMMDFFEGKYSLNLSSGEQNVHIYGAPNGSGIGGEVFTFSLQAKNCEGSQIGIFTDTTFTEGASTTLYFDTEDTWQRFAVSYAFPLTIFTNDFYLYFNNTQANCLIDALKLEKSDKATPYSPYGSKALVYEKLLPNYLINAGDGISGLCYSVHNGSYYKRDDAPAECDNYARKCTKEEVGCDLFTSIKNGISVPARVVGGDYCPKECDGYDNYTQLESNFENQQIKNFIPKTAHKCSASAVGCDEFTNLDKIGEDAEKKEYYSWLKQCVKDTNPTCAAYYAWEGSDETGYQLLSFVLQASSTTDHDLKLTSNDSTECNNEIYHLPQSDPRYNPDCKEFYDTDGNAYYHLNSRVITCSDNCHPYRITGLNIDWSISHANCDETENKMHWDSGIGLSGACIVCKNGGVWNDEHHACLYSAIPDEGTKCSAHYAGCREYSGPDGNNTKIILNDIFESGDVDSWASTGTIEVSNESLLVSGHSLGVSGNHPLISKNIANKIHKGRSYYLSFIAKQNGAAIANIELVAIGSSTAEAERVDFVTDEHFNNDLNSDWKIYKYNIDVFDREPTTKDSLFVKASADFYIDNIRLTEIMDRYFLVKNSWNTPDSCYEDVSGAYRGPDFNLGCAGYKDNSNETHYLRQFSSLCSESAIGCELMIDTYNYSEPYQLTDSSPVSNIDITNIIPNDAFVYMVYKEKAQCNSYDKGCQLFGGDFHYQGNDIGGVFPPIQHNEQSLFTPTYLKNDPDKYNSSQDSPSILCNEGENGCDAWTSKEGVSYFKNPLNQVCEWRLGSSSLNWYRRYVSFCDENDSGAIENGEDNLCLKDDDCSNNHKCILDKNDYLCNTTNLKTLGFGGYANRVSQPVSVSGDYWPGLCPSSQSSCTEFADIVSSYNQNLLFNPTCKNDLDGDNTTFCDGWEYDGTNYTQTINLKAYTLYTLHRNIGNATLTYPDLYVRVPDSGVSLYRLNMEKDNPNNILQSSGGGHSISDSVNTVVFYITFTAGTSDTVPVVIGYGDPNHNSEVSLREATVDYQIKENLDYEACNGVADYGKGCVVFNERSVSNGGDYLSLVYDAYHALDNDGSSLRTCPDGSEDCSGNVLLKVSPNRICDEWLSCRSYVKDEETGENICYDISACNAMDDDGNCSNFITENDPRNQEVSGAADYQNFANSAGYVKVGLAGIDDKTMKGDLKFGSMSQIGEMADITNGNFEIYGSNNYPVGWYPVNYNNVETPWDKNKFVIVNNPVQAERDGIKYPREGHSFIRVSPSSVKAMSDFIDVEPGTEYVLSFDINTLNFHLGSSNTETATDDDKALAGARIYYFNQAGNQINNTAVYALSGQDWTKKIMHITTPGNAYSIKIVLEGIIRYNGTRTCTYTDASGVSHSFNYQPYVNCSFEGGYDYTVSSCPSQHNHIAVSKDSCSGRVYFDNIQLRPALQNKINPNYYTSQTCRLYPQTDSLSCDYLEDSGKRQRGLWGYCLEYDRFPGNSDACLMWYPVDRVNGDGIDEGAGYSGRFPVYYCTDISPASPLNIVYNENIHETPPNNTRDVDLGRDYKIFDHNAYLYIHEGGADNSVYEIQIHNASTNQWSEKLRPDSSGADRNWNFDTKFSEYQGVIIDKIRIICVDGDQDNDNCEVSWMDSGTGIRAIPYCEELIQTVTPTGKNKYWAARVFPGSSVEEPCNRTTELPSVNVNMCHYYGEDAQNVPPVFTSFYYPFGSVPYIGYSWDIFANPFEWDGDSSRDGKQPLFYYYRKDVAGKYPKMGQLHFRDNVQRLFARSYGRWTWSGNVSSGSYQRQSGGLWTPPTVLCDCGGANDLCGNPPKVFNIEVDGCGSNSTENSVVNIGVSKFVNLTFNVLVDSQQLPITMYSVDWGDGEKTVVTGVEMRDRSSRAFSLYHLYNYWDIKKRGECVNPAGITNACIVKPRIKIKDNWGWCTGGASGNICGDDPSNYVEYPGQVIVNETNSYSIDTNCVAGSDQRPEPLCRPNVNFRE